MKKTALVCINAKFIHSALGIYSISRYAKKQGIEVDVLEYSINHNEMVIDMDVFKGHYDVVAFSCYIFNIEYVIKVASVLKKANPHLSIWLGGPEVSFSPEEYLSYPFVDGVMIGEGEVTFAELYHADFCATNILGCAYKKDGEILKNAPRPTIANLDEIPFAYSEEDLPKLKDKLIYYETSRGCPFRCSYCLSSTDHGVRYYSLDRVRENLLFFISHHIPLVKFVDRTFNADNRRAAEIMRFIANNPGETTFHMEISADLLTDEICEIVENSRDGLFQVEVGIQSTNPKTLDAICRGDHFEGIKRSVLALLKTKKAHVHVDLIAGLPYENLDTFKASFNTVYALHAHDLQLGFLKLLKGTKIRAEKAIHHYRFTDYPPYEIIGNDFLEYADIVRLKKIEDVLERYHNSQSFILSLSFLESKYSDAFTMFDELSKYFCKIGQSMQPCSKPLLYDFLVAFYREKFGDTDEFCVYLAYDYYQNLKVGKAPDWYLDKSDETFRESCLEFLYDEDHIKTYLPEFMGEPPKKILKHVRFLQFPFDPLNRDEKGKIVYIFENISKSAIKIVENA